MADADRVGKKIHALREQRGMTVADLADQSQCAANIIEELEAGEMTPSLAPLTKIARGLGVHLGTFIDTAPHPGPAVVRADAREEVAHFSGIGHASRWGTLDFYSLAVNKEGRHMEPFIIDIHPTVEEDITLSVHEGEEFIYVVTGSIEVTYGDEQLVLNPGDSIYYDSTTPHEVRAAGEEDARILAVVYATF